MSECMVIFVPILRRKVSTSDLVNMVENSPRYGYTALYNLFIFRPKSRTMQCPLYLDPNSVLHYFTLRENSVIFPFQSDEI